MSTYFLSVLVPLESEEAKRTGVHHVVTVLRVTCDASLQWVREHADEIARRQCGDTYNALMISETPPDDGSGRQRHAAPAAAAHDARGKGRLCAPHADAWPAVDRARRDPGFRLGIAQPMQ
jgi:hypothetical protein